MVNADHVKRKLPSLLCHGNTSERKNNNMFMKNRYRLQQFIKRKPQKFNSLANQLCAILDELDKEMIESIKGYRIDVAKKKGDSHKKLNSTLNNSPE